jgi:hypothetical protein
MLFLLQKSCLKYYDRLLTSSNLYENIFHNPSKFPRSKQIFCYLLGLLEAYLI